MAAIFLETSTQVRRAELPEVNAKRGQRKGSLLSQVNIADFANLREVFNIIFTLMLMFVIISLGMCKSTFDK